MIEQIAVFVAIGFAAQLVDGAMGMAYGLMATSVLLSYGVPPVTASASVHAAELFTSGASGLSHWRFGNLRQSWVWRLAVPGMVGGAIGAYLLSSIPGEKIRPFIAVYLVIMGAMILARALRKARERKEPRRLEPLGLVGGFLDSVGGGGWGAMVTSTLIGTGASPRYAIGSTSLAEFFVTATISGMFVLTTGLQLWPIILGLVIGGVIAAPFAAYAAKRLPPRPLMILVGLVIIGLSIRDLVRAFTS